MGVHESPQSVGTVRTVGIDARQRGRAQDGARRLDFPEQLLGFRVSPVVEVFDIDDVQASAARAAVIRLNGTYRRQPVANPNRLTDFGDLRSGAASHVLTSDPSRSDRSSRFNPGRHCRCSASWRLLAK